jgi:small subunit ribosomal protein S15
MSITKENKKEIISKFAINANDTGSADVQIAVLSERINNLIDHLKVINTIITQKEVY